MAICPHNPPLGPNLSPQTVEIDARPGWGLYRVTFKVQRNPRRGMLSWFWTLDTGEHIDLGKWAPGAGFLVKCGC